MTNIINGKQIAQDIINDLKSEVQQLIPHTPKIVFIRIGDDPASVAYVNIKQKMAHEVGLQSDLIRLKDTVSDTELYEVIDNLNESEDVHGILIQAPLPKHLNERDVFNRVHPLKDVDGFSASNLGRLCQEDPTGFVACTPAGIVEMFKRENITTEGKHVVVIGRSLIVGKPMGLLMLQKSLQGNATVTICHSKTKNIEKIIKEADIVITAIGKAHFIKENMIKKGAIVIDVGQNKIKDPSRKSGYRMTGDVDFENVEKVASKITPVPGGVGPMTVALLMTNTIKAFHLQNQNKKAIA